ncbi:MAG: methionyl-tRNA synthetase [Nocardioidaceae bacterium]|jgi:methionyl-tRNA synthetase|nr:methionyl-tRNA synthetase [Nocardioidaceae bacterium]
MSDTVTKAFYVTTPIYYVTAAPSIGSAYTTVAGDVISRWHRQRGEDVWYLTGTDEHGQKVMRAAAENGMTPQAWTDHLVETAWRPVLDTIDAANDQFIRTTDPAHKQQVQEFWTTVRDNGDVYEGRYEGPYCVDCEEFKLPSDVEIDDEGTQVCPIHHTPLEIVSETNYFFAMSKYTQRLLDLYERHPEFVQPESARNEVISFVRQGLQDLSISRSSFAWGVPVPWDASQVFYVWIDALLNYATAVGYGIDKESFERRWPANIHLVGKDILRFHAVIWPAMLMAAGVDVPRQVFAHGWLLVGGQKMSKSNATAIAPEVVTDHFGSDAYRYYFMRTIAFGSDGSFSWEHMSAVYTSELANGLGNLASRVTAMVARYFDGVLPQPGTAGDAESALSGALAATVATAESAIDRVAIHEAITAVANFVGDVNIYVSEQEPWQVAKDESPEGRQRLATILYTAAESLRAIAVLHNPVMPKASALLWDAVGAHSLGRIEDQRVGDVARWGQLPPGSRLTKGASLFPRLSDDAE